MSVFGLVACGGNTVTPTLARDAAIATDTTATTDTPTATDTATATDQPMVTVDVPPPPTDRGPSAPRGLGEPCDSDAQCASRICAATTNVAGTCATPCQRSSDCASRGPRSSCTFDRPSLSARIAAVCAEAPPTAVDDGESCMRDDECASGLCFGAQCHNICGDNTECPAGWTCGPQIVNGGAVRMCGFAPVARVSVESYTLYEGSTFVDRGTNELRVLVPSDAVSITWTTQDLEGSNLFAAVASVTDPEDRALVDLRSWSILNEQEIRTVPSRYQFNTARWPARDGVRVAAGAYRSAHLLFNDRGVTTVTSRRVRAAAILKRAAGGVVANDWRLRVRVFVVGLNGVTAATAPTNTRLQRALTLVRQYYAAANVGFEVTGYADVTGADATRFAVIDSRDEFRELLTRSASSAGPVLNLFLVRGISGSAGLENAIGVAGAIDGPPGIHGTTQSGVLVGWESTQSVADFLPITIAHECGHYLGLWHVREGYTPCTVPNPPAGTMCSPFGGVDAISDTPRDDASARQYMMYWQTTLGNNNTSISAGQSLVMRGNPLIQ
jgi:hypothetical protein